MVIMIPMPSFTGGGGPWRSRPSRVGLGVSAALFASYLAVPLYNRALFIDLPTAFGIQVTEFGIQSLGFVFPLILGFSYLFVALFTLFGAETVRWWEWALYAVSVLLVLFWILPLIASNNNLAAEFCRVSFAQGQSYWDNGCLGF